MAQIDVTDILSDPDFVDQICVVDRIPGVNNFGENTLKEVSVNSIGCVQPASGKALQRVPEAMRQANMSNFWFKGTITTSSPGKYSSILVFKNARYQVVTVFDWSNFGKGYTEGLCVAEVPAP